MDCRLIQVLTTKQVLRPFRKLWQANKRIGGIIGKLHVQNRFPARNARKSSEKKSSDISNYRGGGFSKQSFGDNCISSKCIRFGVG